VPVLGGWCRYLFVVEESLQGGLYSISSNGRWCISLVRVDVDAIEVTILDITATVACDQLTRHIGIGSRRKRNQARVDLQTADKCHVILTPKSSLYISLMIDESKASNRYPDLLRCL
jgi:hypothetical protein